MGRFLIVVIFLLHGSIWGFSQEELFFDYKDSLCTEANAFHKIIIKTVNKNKFKLIHRYYHNKIWEKILYHDVVEIISDTSYLISKYKLREKAGEFVIIYEKIDSTGYMIKKYNKEGLIMEDYRSSRLFPIILNGEYNIYHDNGVLKEKRKYKDNCQYSVDFFDDDGNELQDAKVYFKEEIDEMPEFPGGKYEMCKFFMKHLKYPEEAKAQKVQGVVYISFTVNENGSLSDFAIIKGIKYLNHEALRVAKLMPRWIPGKLNGVPVKTKTEGAINFRIYFIHW